MEDY
jgi:hypothetical protein